MRARIKRGGLQVANALIHLVENKIIPGIDLAADTFWKEFEKSLEELGPENEELLQKRNDFLFEIAVLGPWPCLAPVCASFVFKRKAPYSFERLMDQKVP